MTVFMISLITCFLSCTAAHALQSGDIKVYEFAKNGEVLSFIYFGAGNEFENALSNYNGMMKQLEKIECVSLIGPDIVQSQLNCISRMTSLHSLHLGFYPDPVTIENAAVLELSTITNMARSQDLWVKLISKSGVECWECAGQGALSLSHSAQSRSQRSATASEAHRRSFGLEP